LRALKNIPGAQDRVAVVTAAGQGLGSPRGGPPGPYGPTIIVDHFSGSGSADIIVASATLFGQTRPFALMADRHDRLGDQWYRGADRLA
jgi:hypothetical protein